MTGDGLPDGVVPVRAGAVWTSEEQVALLEGVRDGRPVEDLAVLLQRRESALVKRCKQMLPPGVHPRQAEVDATLREYLADPAFDPYAHLRANTGSVWSPDRDEVLRHGWQQARPIAVLTGELTVSEVEIAQRLVRLGLAESISAVVERLGSAPDGDLAARSRMSRDRAAAAVWVLVIDGLASGRHLSLHASREDAQSTLDEVAARHVAQGGDPADLAAEAGQRVAGSGSAGGTHRLEPTVARPHPDGDDWWQRDPVGEVVLDMIAIDPAALCPTVVADPGRDSQNAAAGAFFAVQHHTVCPTEALCRRVLDLVRAGHVARARQVAEDRVLGGT